VNKYSVSKPRRFASFTARNESADVMPLPLKVEGTKTDDSQP
jgi:hypothetical protein